MPPTTSYLGTEAPITNHRGNRNSSTFLSRAPRFEQLRGCSGIAAPEALSAGLAPGHPLGNEGSFIKAVEVTGRMAQEATPGTTRLSIHSKSSKRCLVP